jgi:hypothetical protein
MTMDLGAFAILLLWVGKLCRSCLLKKRWIVKLVVSWFMKYCAVRTLKRNWIVTEYRWPTPLDRPCEEESTFVRLDVNKQFLIEHDALFVEGSVDGLYSINFIRTLLHPYLVDLVVWGSPHTCVANGDYSGVFDGSHSDFKAEVFAKLCTQYKYAFVVITFCFEKLIVLPSMHHDLHNSAVYIESCGGFGYVPRNSLGTPRCSPGDVRALVAVPAWGRIYFQAATSDTGKLHLSKLVHLISARADHRCNLFLGEGACDLSATLVAYHLSVW